MFLLFFNLFRPWFFHCLSERVWIGWGHFWRFSLVLLGRNYGVLSLMALSGVEGVSTEVADSRVLGPDLGTSRSQEGRAADESITVWRLLKHISFRDVLPVFLNIGLPLLATSAVGALLCTHIAVLYTESTTITFEHARGRVQGY
ncbi:uncharacterized protein BDZ99DRAFT_35328 [Mytilinidion resinicola]|uniref:Uncharacterized protein n=1 Tax=Mytilinidion resinicola TaxID=574789 RepID=A0A6A6YLH4_9PEZI|nr:uncharacterized protein BDZ99DRAFT_35328 [Mytilinidion resinicola]KAF2809726.1 hypothetical protein BDZ99DRAFT_35328 [Mytilinidion resinicola]